MKKLLRIVFLGLLWNKKVSC